MRAAEQARDDDRPREGEKWRRRKGERQTRQSNANTLHLVIHLPTTTTPTAAAASAATAATRTVVRCQ